MSREPVAGDTGRTETGGGGSGLTVFVWILAVTPVFSLLALLPLDPTSILRSAPQKDPASLLGPLLATLSVVLLVYAGSALAAYFDWRGLGVRRFQRRFHWAWGLVGPAVYLVGRCVVIAKQTTRKTTFAPLWAYCASATVTAIAVVYLTALAAVLLTVPPHTAGSDASSSNDAGSQEKSIFDLEAGDCFANPTGGRVESVTIVSCSDAHDAEVYYGFQIDEASWPGADAVHAIAEKTCKSQFEAFIGLDYNDSDLHVNFYTPLQDGWSSPRHREVTCAVSDPAGQTTGTLAQARR